MMSFEAKVDRVRALVSLLLNGNENALAGSCLFHAVAVHRVFGAPIAAGSYSWKFTSQDDGTNPTHFSCIFDETAEALAGGILQHPEIAHRLAILPEMHVWNVLEDGRVLDLTTLHTAKFARNMGFEFEKDLIPPPVFLGRPADTFQQRWLYKENLTATRLARLLASSIEQDLATFKTNPE